MFTVAWLDERRKKRRDLMAAINENTGLRAQLALCRHKLGLERIAHQVEIRRHSETLEHLRLMSKDNQRLTFQVELYRKFFEATVPDPYETDL